MATEHVSEYFSGQGKLWIAPVMGGVIQHNKSRWVGNVPELTLETEVETEVHKESWSGRRAKDLVLKKRKIAEIHGKTGRIYQRKPGFGVSGNRGSRCRRQCRR